MSLECRKATRPSVGSLNWPELHGLTGVERERRALSLVAEAAIREFDHYEKLFDFGQSLIGNDKPPLGVDPGCWSTVRECLLGARASWWIGKPQGKRFASALVEGSAKLARSSGDLGECGPPSAMRRPHLEGPRRAHQHPAREARHVLPGVITTIHGRGMRDLLLPYRLEQGVHARHADRPGRVPQRWDGRRGECPFPRVVQALSSASRRCSLPRGRAPSGTAPARCPLRVEASRLGDEPDRRTHRARHIGRGQWARPCSTSSTGADEWPRRPARFTHRVGRPSASWSTRPRSKVPGRPMAWNRMDT